MKKLRFLLWLAGIALLILVLTRFDWFRNFLFEKILFRTERTLQPTALTITEVRGLAELVSAEWMGEVVASSYEPHFETTIGALRSVYEKLRHQPQRSINFEEYWMIVLLRESAGSVSRQRFVDIVRQNSWEAFFKTYEMPLTVKAMGLYRGPRISYLARGKVQAGVDLKKTRRLEYDESSSTLTLSVPVEVLGIPIVNPVFLEAGDPSVPGYELIEGEDLNLGDPKTAEANQKTREACLDKLRQIAVAEMGILDTARESAEATLTKLLSFFSYEGNPITRVKISDASPAASPLPTES